MAHVTVLACCQRKSPEHASRSRLERVIRCNVLVEKQRGLLWVRHGCVKRMEEVRDHVQPARGILARQQKRTSCRSKVCNVQCNRKKIRFQILMSGPLSGRFELGDAGTDPLVCPHTSTRWSSFLRKL